MTKPVISSIWWLHEKGTQKWRRRTEILGIWRLIDYLCYLYLGSFIECSVLLMSWYTLVCCHLPSYLKNFQAEIILSRTLHLGQAVFKLNLGSLGDPVPETDLSRRLPQLETFHVLRCFLTWNNHWMHYPVLMPDLRAKLNPGILFQSRVLITCKTESVSGRCMKCAEYAIEK
jgi:hypothetical protein